jgi:cytochrome c5
VLLLIVLVVCAWRHRFGEPESFDQMDDQFKYGSIGADHPLAQAPLPYWLWRALPELFDPAVVTQGRPPTNGQPGWAAFGLVSEAAMPARATLNHGAAFDRPIGFSRRRVFGMDFVGLNCAFCHLGTLQAAPGQPVQTVLGGVGNGIDIEQYFLYLFSTLQDPGFTGERVMAAVDRQLALQRAELGFVQRLLYRWVVIPLLPLYVKHIESRNFDFVNPRVGHRLQDFGPGRVDTWGLYKRVFVDPPIHDQINGSSDFPPLWNQKAREGMRLHWDGNTDVLIERNIISALSLVGRHVSVLDYPGIVRVTEWIDGLLPPRYADRAPPDKAIDMGKARRGALVFEQQCRHCHQAGGDRTGRVEPIAGLGTDPERFREFVPALEHALNRVGTHEWQLRHFRVQQGYVNGLLDGVWLRAPYLHNGSVPTLRDLLEPPDKRPVAFCRGGALFDWDRVGFVATPTVVDGQPTCPRQFLYDTRPGSGAGAGVVASVPNGRSNAGHLYGTDLPEDQKAELVEFLKTL